jgi:nitroreductase
MDFFETVQSRHSVRDYLPREVEEEKLTKILTAVNNAPSAGNLQSYDVVLVKDEATKSALAAAAFGQRFIVQAPVVLVFCANRIRGGSKYKERGADLYAVQDATIAAAYCQLAATAQELSTCWVGAFNPDTVAEAIGITTSITPVAIIPIGYAFQQPSPTPRRALSDLVHEGNY